MPEKQQTVHIENLTEVDELISVPPGCLLNSGIAQQHNIGLNRKLTIDSNGFIRIFPQREEEFGHIDIVDIGKLIKSSEIQAIWKTKNDDIETCKDCIYRYCCFSCTEVLFKNGKMFKNEYCDALHEE